MTEQRRYESRHYPINELTYGKIPDIEALFNTKPPMIVLRQFIYFIENNIPIKIPNIILKENEKPAFEEFLEANRDLFGEERLNPQVEVKLSELLKKREVSSVDSETGLTYINLKTSYSIEQCYSDLFFAKKKIDFYKTHNIPLKEYNADSKIVQKIVADVDCEPIENAFMISAYFICPECGYEFERRPIDINRNRMRCPNVVGEKGQTCGTTIHYNDIKSVSIKTYKYQISTRVNNKTEVFEIESLYKIDGYANELTLLIYGEKNKILCFNSKEINPNFLDEADTKELPVNIISTKDLVPDLIYKIDNYIERFSGDKLDGFYDIKFGIVAQKFTHLLFGERQFNIFLGGEGATGKNFNIERYGSFLYGKKFKYSSSTSITIPGLRGGSKSSNNGDFSFNQGLLSTKHLLFIDELKSKPELLTMFKEYLSGSTISNNTATGNQVDYERLAQCVISENIDNKHLQNMSKEIKEQYNNSVQLTTKEAKTKFDPSWNLLLPIEFYNYNPILKRAIRIVRQQYSDANKSWIDGNEWASMSRYFMRITIFRNESVRSIQSNILSNNLVDDDEEKYNIRKKLYTKNVDELVLRYKKFIKPEKCIDNEKAMDIINKYSDADYRTIRYARIILEVSRMINQRLFFCNVDYERLERCLYLNERYVLLEEMNKKYFESRSNISLKDFEFNIDKEEEEVAEKTDETDLDFDSKEGNIFDDENEI